MKEKGHKHGLWIFRSVMKVSAGMLIGFMVVNSFARIVAQNTPEPVNPFLEYADIFNGANTSAVAAHGLTCRQNTYEQVLSQRCIILPDTGAFSQIEVTFATDIIRKITFIMRDNRLRFGNTVLFFGVPHSAPQAHQQFFFWRKSLVMVSTTTLAYPRLVRPVVQVSFMDINLSVDWIRHAANN